MDCMRNPKLNDAYLGTQEQYEESRDRCCSHNFARSIERRRRRVSTLFQPNFGVFAIDLSGGGCWVLHMSNRYSHPPSKKCDLFRCESRFSSCFSCVSAHLQLKFSLSLFWGVGPKISAFLKVKLLITLFFVFQLAKTGCSPSAHDGGDGMLFFKRKDSFIH